MFIEISLGEKNDIVDEGEVHTYTCRIFNRHDFIGLVLTYK